MSPGEFSFLGAAKRQQDAAALADAPPTTTTAADESDQYKWMKAVVGPGLPGEGTPYYVHSDTFVSSWEEPDEPYWIFNADLEAPDPNFGLQYPAKKDAPKDPLEGYTGYNPKIHGNYDPKADYAAYHNKKREEESGFVAPVALPPGYGAEMILNARTGHAQANRPGAEHHNDAAKSGRQLNAFFDADAAAEAHQGRSLKEERQKQHLSKQQVAEFKRKKADRKRKKELDFYRS
ncbi:uncharacterized protein RCC_07735 [Ramularia collo-cygni]|uniref:WW domain-containing protein n=1 Tax=Ramularia collo-cygni TaxID=112498 RepID=A0A2D3VIL4_9PEZI|nr:uncharacterized protein RCC_07735 [Ramularia collo-cygni]CZT21869.1 uncharacterized protein RCC_07735 [Ramularia collo-cygni]